MPIIYAYYSFLLFNPIIHSYFLIIPIIYAPIKLVLLFMHLLFVIVPFVTNNFNYNGLKLKILQALFMVTCSLHKIFIFLFFFQ
jgi:hypothetical protein